MASALHLLGAAVFGWQALRLVRRAGEARRRSAALAVFAISAVAVLVISGTYHGLPVDHAWKPFLQRADHSAIFLLIAGTLTCFHAVGLMGRGRSWMVGLVWVVALVDHLGEGWFWPSVFGPHEFFHVAVLTALFLHWRFFHAWALPGRVIVRPAGTLSTFQRA
jgi:predicted membrane channel-forming protein YqfA (hemolysin III family)